MKHTYKLASILIILMLTTQIVGAYPVVGGAVTVKTDKTMYYLGGPVKITVKNGLSQSINFNEIMAKNIRTGAIINTLCTGTDANACPAIGVIVSINPGQTYTVTWYPSSKGTYRAYVDWWTEGTVTCQAIGCPDPEPGISGRTYSNYFLVR